MQIDNVSNEGLPVASSAAVSAASETALPAELTMTSQSTPQTTSQTTAQTTAQTALPRMIKLDAGRPHIVSDTWYVVRDADEASARVAQGATALQCVLIPVDSYLAALDQSPDVVREAGVWIAPEADFEEWASRLADVPVVAIDFPSFRDGRGLSIGVMLRTRYGFRGELRAIGDVLRDQLEYMRRCGFDAFCVRADKNIEDALKGFSELSVRYQGTVGDPTPLFRRRGGVAA